MLDGGWNKKEGTQRERLDEFEYKNGIRIEGSEMLRAEKIDKH